MNYKGGMIKKKCIHCGMEFEVFPYIKDKAKFCSRMCRDKFGHTKEAREKMSNSHKGKKLSKEHKDKISKSVSIALTGKKFSEETKQKQSESHKGKTGDKSSNWRGGISFEPYPPEWTKTLKESIRQRDNFTCQYCGEKQTTRKLDVHHIDYNKENLNPDNLISLCLKCHRITSGNRDYHYALCTYTLENK
jgi:hypothetical protein